MAKMKEMILAIQTCSDCYGKGMTGWVSPDGDYDFEYCDCNPHKLIFGEDF